MRKLKWPTGTAAVRIFFSFEPHQKKTNSRGKGFHSLRTKRDHAEDSINAKFEIYDTTVILEQILLWYVDWSIKKFQI